MTSALAGAYDNAAASWAAGPELVYERLAERLVSHAGELDHRLALDAGTGSGVAARVLQRVGARVVACDLAHGMLVHRAAARPPATVGDITRLPFRDGVVDVAVAAFVINHLAAPTQGLRELARVVTPRGVVLASSFAAGPEPAIKRIVEDVAVSYGWSRPGWYAEIKASTATQTESIAQLDCALRTAGFAVHEAWEEPVDFSDLDATALVAWRLGMPAMTPFIQSLRPEQRRELRRTAEAEAARTAPTGLTMLVGRGRPTS